MVSLWVKGTSPVNCFRLYESLWSSRHCCRQLCSLRWEGTISPFSEFADHVLIGDAIAPISTHDAIQASMGGKVVAGTAAALPSQSTIMTPQQLLELGSVWYLPKHQHEQNQKQVKHAVFKPTRLSLDQSSMELQGGDYLRIHHTPRRYPAVYEHSWKLSENGQQLKENASGEAPQSRAVAKVGDGYCVINKDPQIPVHATVDNIIENVIFQLKSHNDDCYAVPVQRIDVGTSGLFVVATNRAFAAYFAQLLRRKTKQRVGNRDITKTYKCLVCLQIDPSALHHATSLEEAWDKLQKLQNQTIQHFLEPSDRCPRKFHPNPPPVNPSVQSPWLECILKVLKVSKFHRVDETQERLVGGLWSSTLKPDDTKGICEVEIQLETGRTHQIRGQMAELGFPLVGDELYGGAHTVPLSVTTQSEQPLALQCYKIGFWEADYVELWDKRKRRHTMQAVRSDRWSEIFLDQAWWTPILAAERQQ